MIFYFARCIQCRMGQTDRIWKLSAHKMLHMTQAVGKMQIQNFKCKKQKGDLQIMKELQVPFDSAWILKNRRKIKKALLADGTPRMEKDCGFGRFDHK